ncbi:sodium- and chloride-dependent glycine transporter 1-like [Oppia nitens]|uniref:sodium- and chloride-dependent glycine transporter 1-like n=1 Tax=Oppia nitens TaxID=1686743 RepID=UPI0023DC4C3B|nr:sodium- and chloride-dependent glycine transporter 1-like [Oppia nitens]
MANEKKKDGSVAVITDSTNDNNNKDPKSVRWSSKIEFILTCLSYVIGFGNIWRFPYICYKNGGGAFLIPYFLSLAFIGYPVIVLEMTLGQYSSKGKVSVWKFMPIFQGIGYSMLIMVAVQSVYYNVLVGWSLRYLFASITIHELPWKSCNHSWNTEECKAGYVNGSAKSPSDEYFHENVLDINKNINDISQLNISMVGCLLIAWTICFGILFKGVKSVGKVSYLTTIFPYICLIILFLRGIVMEGAWNGIKFYINPDFSKLLTLGIWVDACQQIFFSLGIAWGTIITLASYNNFDNHVIRDATIIALGNSFTSIFAGFVIFAYMGAVAHERGVSVADVAVKGSGLAFMMYPEAVAMFPWGQLFSFIFFFMLIMLGLGSQTPSLESVLTSLMEFNTKSQKYRIWLLGLVCFIGFICGLIFCNRAGMYWFVIFNDFVASTSAMFVALVEVVSIAWVYGIDKFADHIKEMVGHHIKPKIVWKIVWLYITPIILFVLLIITMLSTEAPEYRGYIFPKWTIIFGWIIIVAQVIPIPIVSVYYLYVCYKNKSGIKEVSNPDIEWKSQDLKSDVISPQT